MSVFYTLCLVAELCFCCNLQKLIIFFVRLYFVSPVIVFMLFIMIVL
jgi:hypothetical protein